MSTRFEGVDYWKAFVLYGLNQATYKIALRKTKQDELGIA